MSKEIKSDLPHIPTDEEIEEERRKLKIKSQHKETEKKEEDSNHGVFDETGVAEILEKNKVLLGTIATQQTKISELTEDRKLLKDEVKDLKGIIKENSFVKAGDIDQRLVLLQEDNKKLHSLYLAFTTILITHDKLETVVVDPLNKKAWLKDITDDEMNRMLVRAYRRMQTELRLQLAEKEEGAVEHQDEEIEKMVIDGDFITK